MRRFALAIFFAVFFCSSQVAQGAARRFFSSAGIQFDWSSPPQQNTSAAPSTIILPSGTKVILALTSPIWAGTAKLGGTLHAQTAFPVVLNDQIAIPVGTYIEGQVDAVIRPTWRTNRAEFQIYFTRIIFVNGYVVLLSPSADEPPLAPDRTNTTNSPADIAAAFANVSVQVSSASDILLDNGSQIEMLLQVPLSLDARSVADAARRSKPLSPAQFKTASLCRPTPGTPGTPDTVVPGSPGTPGTPPTVIPQGPGMPDIVIPGTPGTPGTPDTVIHGTPGTPGVSCPTPPIVTFLPSMQGGHTELFHLDAAVQLHGQQFSPGAYQITWKGLGPAIQAAILQNGRRVASVQARIVGLTRVSSSSTSALVSNPDGSSGLRSLRFAGESFALYFDQDIVPQSAPGAAAVRISTQ